MKYLLIPGMPLFVIAATLHDQHSPIAVIAYLLSLFLFITGGSFIVIYALYRFIR